MKYQYGHYTTSLTRLGHLQKCNNMLKYKHNNKIGEKYERSW